jgi:3-phenylpropionate/trans-cinnamate dioxygenase ferredoxin reductase subunit
MADVEHIVIVGAGLAGAKAAEAARQEGYAGRLTLVGGETHFPYERPPFSKDVLIGPGTPAQARVHEDPAFYARNEIDLLLGTEVTKIETGDLQVELAGKRTLGFDRLVLAMGSRARHLGLDGIDEVEAHYLRTQDDSLSIREALRPGRRLVMVGASWIGTEVAAAARQRGADVLLLDPLSVPLERVLGAEVGAYFRDLHADHGVDVRTGTGVERFEPAGDGGVRVHVEGGGVEEGDILVVGVGAEPVIDLAADAGLDVGEGVLVDAELRTSHPAIWAAGDIAEHDHPLTDGRVRVEHWANALNQGTTAGRNVAGRSDAYDRLPYFFSDQYDTGLEYSGWPEKWDRIVFRGSPSDGEFMAFYLRDGMVRAGINVNVWDVNQAVQDLVRSERQIDVERLADPDTDLAALS